MATTNLQTVSRAIALLRLFDGGAVAFTVKELSDRLELNRINTMRLARTLLSEGLLTHDPQTRQYALSLSCLALCRNLIDRNGLAEAARPHMEAAREATGETVCLMVRERWRRIIAASVHSRQPVRFVLEVGERMPIYVGAAGRCLVAGLSASEKRLFVAHLEEERRNGATGISLNQIEDSIVALHDRGWAVGRGEWSPEAAGAAAPIYDKDGATVAAITIAMPLSRATPAHLDRCGQAALTAARATSKDA